MLQQAIRRAAVLLAVTGSPVAAQDPPAREERAAREASEELRRLRVFLDCHGGCDFDHIRTETPWVAFVRDRTAADVHLLVTRLTTGAGGQEYTLALVGLGSFAAREDTLSFVSRPGQPSAVVRDGLTRTIHLGLVPFAARTANAGRIRVVAMDEGDGSTAPTSVADDPWNSWVFGVGLGGSYEDEERQRELEVDADLDARRITADWKLGISARANVERERFELDEEFVTSRRESYSAGAVAVRSLGSHWGAGAQLSFGSSTFDNTRAAVRLAPAVEYSAFPYDEATRRQLTVQYSVGVSAFRYREETIFDRISETRPTQALVIGYDVEQPWGSADAEVELSNYLDDFQQHRVDVDGGVDLRLLRGLELRVGANASLIRDQLAIVKRDATPEEILLQRRALQTDYRYGAYVGISYTFGSIFNSVVNPRFGTGPGQILR